MTSIIYNYLTDEEKNNVIISHIKSNEQSLFNTELKRIEAIASSASEDVVLELDSQISVIQTVISSLKDQQALLVL